MVRGQGNVPSQNRRSDAAQLRPGWGILRWPQVGEFGRPPGRYVGAEAQEDDGEPFEEKMKRLTATLREQQAEAAKLDVAIAANLKELGYGG